MAARFLNILPIFFNIILYIYIYIRRPWHRKRRIKRACHIWASTPSIYSSLLFPTKATNPGTGVGVGGMGAACRGQV